MDKLDYALLDFMLNTCQAKTKMSATSRKRILSEFEVKNDTLYRRLKHLIENGYAENGIKESREHTYFITDKGINALKEAMK